LDKKPEQVTEVEQKIREMLKLALSDGYKVGFAKGYKEGFEAACKVVNA
jgi:flagellar biosynthesis/type III secretory pathway protein FliH